MFTLSLQSSSITIRFLFCQYKALEWLHLQSILILFLSFRICPDSDIFHDDRFIFEIHHKYNPRSIIRNTFCRCHPIWKLCPKGIFHSGFSEHITVNTLKNS